MVSSSLYRQENSETTSKTENLRKSTLNGLNIGKSCCHPIAGNLVDRCNCLGNHKPVIKFKSNFTTRIMKTALDSDNHYNLRYDK